MLSLRHRLAIPGAISQGRGIRHVNVEAVLAAAVFAARTGPDGSTFTLAFPRDPRGAGPS
jgi:hypothetical protein